MEWNKVSEKEIPFGEEVIAFNEKWIDEDFNPNGTRVGFMQDDGFISATWNNENKIHVSKISLGKTVIIIWTCFFKNSQRRVSWCTRK